jgi:hypothetical protein
MSGPTWSIGSALRATPIPKQGYIGITMRFETRLAIHRRKNHFPIERFEAEILFAG